MQQHIPRAGPMSASVAGLNIATAQDESDEAHLMDMSGQELTRGMLQAAE